MKREIHVAVMATIAIALVVAPVAGEVTDREVRQAIERGVEFLKAHQDKVRGGWPEHPAQPGGLSALCTLALLNAGVTVDDPAMAKALDYIRSFDKPDMTYSVCAAHDGAVRGGTQERPAHHSPEREVAGGTQLADGTSCRARSQGNVGLFARGTGRAAATTPIRSSRMLALNEAERVGVEVNPATWRLAQEYWQQTQKEDGSWGYKPETPSTGSMTCAGICSLVIADRSAQFRQRLDRRRQGVVLRRGGREQRRGTRIVLARQTLQRADEPG